MPSKKSPPEELVGKAAELRAGGAAWEAVAAQVGRAADTVRRWPALYPALWRKLFQAAERQLVAEATAESVHTLRRQLRSDDEKSSRDAAQKLLQFRVALGRKAKPRGSKSRAKPSDVTRAAAYLETLTDAQVHQLAEDLIAEAVAGRAAAAPPPERGSPPVA